jgi:uncharacterized transporter YbjL
MLGINLPKVCKDYEEMHGGSGKELGGAGSSWHLWEVRAYRVRPGGQADGLRAADAEALIPNARIFVLRVRHDGEIQEGSSDTVLHENDVVAVAGRRDLLVRAIGPGAEEIEDPELVSMPIEGVDVYVSNKVLEGKTLTDLAQMPGARGVFPFGLRRQPILLSRLAIEPGDIALGVVEAHADDRLISSSPSMIVRLEAAASTISDAGIPLRKRDLVPAERKGRDCDSMLCLGTAIHFG